MCPSKQSKIQDVVANVRHYRQNQIPLALRISQLSVQHIQ